MDGRYRPESGQAPATLGPNGAVSQSRRDLRLIASLVPEGARVLDLGCGSGDLLALLGRQRGVRGTGVEISMEGVFACIAKGLPAQQLDLDEGLSGFPDGSFDYVILSQTLQAVRRPAFVLREMLRVGRVGIVSLPNFGHWRILWALLARRRMPRTPALPYEWYETPNLHLSTVADFVDLCRLLDVRIVDSRFLAGGREVRRLSSWRADEAIFTVERA